MTFNFIDPVVLLGLHVLVDGAFVIRALLRPNREPASRIAWVLIIVTLPVLGVVAYVLFGEVNIGRRRIERMHRALAAMPPFTPVPARDGSGITTEMPDRYANLFRVGESVNGFPAVAGNGAQLFADSQSAIDALVCDIDAAREHVHVLFYIWLPDDTGLAVAAALRRAAARGVVCRAMVDSVGSSSLVRSRHWRELGAAGVRLAVALSIGNPLLAPLFGRIDLRNHRKLVVIDGEITYCDSQNCANPTLTRRKRRFAPWVDCVMRLEGPVARQNQHLFATDWETYSGEDLNALLHGPVRIAGRGFTAQVIGTGPTVRHSAMPEVFASLIFTARRELVITTPYFVPDDAMQGALRAAGYRGVDVTMIMPAKNDSWEVAAASRSYYPALMAAGVKIYEYSGGLLHSKLLTLDGDVTLIGSANMDRRSFELNYENNVLLYDSRATAEVRELQDRYIAQSRPITRTMVDSWPAWRRLWHNTVAMLGPVL